MTRKQIVSDEQAEELVQRLYEKSSTEEPSLELDQNILAQAKAGADSVKAGRGFRSTNPLSFWQRFGSVAATLVLVGTIGMLYQQNRDQLSPENPVILTSEPADSAAGQSDTVRQKSVSGESSLRESELHESELDQAPQEEAVFSVADDAAKMDRAEPAARKKEAVETLQDAGALQPLPRVPAAEPAQPMMEEADLPEVKPAMPPATKPVLKEAIRAQNTDANNEGAAKGMVKGAGDDESVEEKSEARLAPERLAPGRSAHEMFRSFTGMPKPVPTTPEPTPPEENIQQVREAIAAGDLEQAERLWLALKASYPDADLPPDLVEFFGNNDQIGEPKQINSDTRSDQNQ